jgi:ribonuclease D
MDLSPLFALMQDPKILKVFHAARQDVEIFVNLTGRVPAPLFDTQVAAMVCGYGEAAAMKRWRQRWQKRRSTNPALYRLVAKAAYRTTDRLCLGDVTHLRIVYEKLAAQLLQNGRVEWFARRWIL